jgi:hypothetical protein
LGWGVGMSWQQFTLPDGRAVRPHPRDATRGMIGSDRHSVEFHDNLVIVTDENGAEVYRGPAQRSPPSQPARRTAVGGPPVPRASNSRAADDTGRWPTLNAFVDATVAGLSRSELAVWIVLFRDVRDGVARTGLTDIARRGGMEHGSAKRAVRSLTAKGLLRVVRRGRKNGGTNVYQVAPVILNGAPAHR